MKTYDLLNLVLTALQTNSALTAYATAQCGRAPRVFDGFSGDFPPVPDECPYILVHSPGKSGNRKTNERGYGLSVDYYLYDTGDETRADNASVSSGTVRLLTMQELGRNAILSTALNEMITGYEDVTNTVDLWPLLVGTTAYDFDEQIFIGMDPLA